MQNQNAEEFHYDCLESCELILKWILHISELVLASLNLKPKVIHFFHPCLVIYLALELNIFAGLTCPCSAHMAVFCCVSIG